MICVERELDGVVIDLDDGLERTLRGSPGRNGISDDFLGHDCGRSGSFPRGDIQLPTDLDKIGVLDESVAGVGGTLGVGGLDDFQVAIPIAQQLGRNLEEGIAGDDGVVIGQYHCRETAEDETQHYDYGKYGSSNSHGIPPFLSR